MKGWRTQEDNYYAILKFKSKKQYTQISDWEYNPWSWPRYLQWKQYLNWSKQYESTMKYILISCDIVDEDFLLLGEIFYTLYTQLTGLLELSLINFNLF